jgi:hypothetical protein
MSTCLVKEQSSVTCPVKWVWLLPALLVTAVVLAGGCQQTDDGHDHIVYPHKPADFPGAVARLLEIHEAITADAPLPGPQVFHVHENDHEHGHDHDHEHIVVGLFDELGDIVRWLPSIAANSDATKELWDRINSSCRELSAEVNAIASEQDPRAAYKSAAVKVREILVRLQQHATEFPSDKPGFGDEPPPGDERSE